MRLLGQITPLDRRHADALADIDWESEHSGTTEHGRQKDELRAEVKDRLAEGDELFFGYWKGDELLGYATLKPHFPGHKHCELYWLAVRKSAQGKGIGKALATFVEDRARRDGFRKIFVYTAVNNPVRKFYEHLGYAFVNEFPGYYGFTTGNTTAVLYGKAL